MAQEKGLGKIVGLEIFDGPGNFPIKTTRIAGGLLWPCKGLLPAAPKDASFHCVQAQCRCRFGYPLKGS